VTVTYTRAPEVEKIANRIIPKHHPHLIAVHKIDYVFRSEAAQTGGKIVAGKTRKIGGLNAFLTLGAAAEEGRPDGDTPAVEPFFVVEIAADIWGILTPSQREALVDHELCHCTTGINEQGEVVLKTRAHDVEEFKAIVERHGLWQPELEDLVKAATGTQLSLLDEGHGDE
jgi:hypothetical protein